MIPVLPVAGEKERQEMAGHGQQFRGLVAGAYFSSPAGVAELGYRGNTPIAGPYPGPSPAALDHLNSLLDELGLGGNHA